MEGFAKSPTAIEPIMPPTPCTPQASNVSSKLILGLMTITKRKGINPARTPIAMAPQTSIKPAAGVTVASPPTAPVIAPSMVGLRFKIQSNPAQVRPAVAPAT